MAESRKLLVVGCARSGTLYSCKLWNAVGLKLGHEWTDEDGSSSHFFAVDAEAYLEFPWERPKGKKAHIGERRSDFDFEHVWHQVRHPLKVIESCALIIPRNEWAWLQPHIGIQPKTKDRTLLSMFYWYRWNMVCQEHAQLTYRLEDMGPELFARQCGMLGLDPDTPMPDVATDTNHKKRYQQPWTDREAIRNAPPLRWADIEQRDPVLTARIRALAQSYGYTQLTDE